MEASRNVDKKIGKRVFEKIEKLLGRRFIKSDS